MNAHPWFADPKFWERTERWLFPQPFWVAASYEVESIARLTGCPNGGNVLDLACGPGRTAIAFARMGYRVTGVDLTQDYLDRATSAATRSELDIEWILEDMRTFRREEAFDLAVCLYNSFGYFADRQADRTVLNHLFDSLHKGGSLVIDHLARELCQLSLHEGPYIETRDGVTVEHHAALIQGDTVLRCEWLVESEGREDRFITEQCVYSAPELERLVGDAGFTEVRCLGNYEGIPFNAEADRLLLIARK